MSFSGTNTVPCDILTQELAEPPSQSEPEPAELSPLSKQNSLLSLTLDEIQYKSGKSFGSMSMDEFLASIWSSDDNQPNNTIPIQNDEEASDYQTKSVATTEPTPQGGSFSVPPPICKKTVDEVWSEIHKGQPQQRNESNNIGTRNETLKKQPTLGEMTLEDFLIKAGVVQESTFSKSKSSSQPITTMPSFQNQISSINASNSNTPLDGNYGVLMRPSMGLGFPSQQNVSGNNGLAPYPMLSHSSNSSVVKDPSSCHSLPESSGSSGRKRIIDGPPEVVVERRQRRMLKNRESAARSRARRQAYTVELEAELNLLKEENEKLKQMLAEAEHKRKQEVSQRKASTKAQKRAEKLREIRRTVSASW